MHKTTETSLKFDQEAFGRKLKALRTTHNLTQAVLAKYLHIGSPHISNIENGKKSPGPDVLVSIANYFHVSTDSFFQDSYLYRKYKEEKQNPDIEQINALLSTMPPEDVKNCLDYTIYVKERRNKLKEK